ncbi:MAG: hypothetical protein ACP5JF_04485 [Candidatus Methanodesulfokora sp.]|jgi:hypothetical protein
MRAIAVFGSAADDAISAILRALSSLGYRTFLVKKARKEDLGEELEGSGGKILVGSRHIKVVMKYKAELDDIFRFAKLCSEVQPDFLVLSGFDEAADRGDVIKIAVVRSEKERERMIRTLKDPVAGICEESSVEGVIRKALEMRVFIR